MYCKTNVRHNWNEMKSYFQMRFVLVISRQTQFEASNWLWIFFSITLQCSQCLRIWALCYLYLLVLFCVWCSFFNFPPEVSGIFGVITSVYFKWIQNIVFGAVSRNKPLDDATKLRKGTNESWSWGDCYCQYTNPWFPFSKLHWGFDKSTLWFI